MSYSEYSDISLQDCPRCGGAALMEEEYGWCLYVSCVDCDCRTVEIPFRAPSEKKEAAKKAAMLWNMGKTVSGVPGE